MAATDSRLFASFVFQLVFLLMGVSYGEIETEGKILVLLLCMSYRHKPDSPLGLTYQWKFSNVGIIPRRGFIHLKCFLFRTYGTRRRVWPGIL
jgi:hypothetical protein